jgi:hypothetical protein
MRFQDWFANVGVKPGDPPLVPPWLRARFGKLFFSAIAFAMDRLVLSARAAVVYRFPSYAPSDVLPYVGDARSIDRYFADTDGTYRARVKAAWDLWFEAGSKVRLRECMEEQGFENVRVYSYRDLGGLVPARWAGWWSAFWVYVGPPTDVTPDGVWSDAGTWDDVVPGHHGAPDGPGVWDAQGINYYEVSQLRKALKKWKVAHEICAEVVFANGEIWEPVAPWDSGVWDDTIVTRIVGNE